MSDAEFDSFAGNYSEALRAGLSVTGETQEYYAAQRISLTARRVLTDGRKIGRVLDYGCGQGSSTPLLRSALGATTAVGADVSEKLLELARQRNSDASVSYSRISDLNTADPFDCIYMNGVLHHIPPGERPATIRSVFNALRPGGLFALWENNPWNPGTRLIMSRIAFDRDAIMLSIPESRALLEQGGFTPLSTDTRFFFPKMLGALRGFEKLLSPTKLGGQYMILAARK